MLGNDTTQQGGPQDADDDDDDDYDEQSAFHMTNIFGQSGSSSFRVRKDEKEVTQWAKSLKKQSVEG